MLNSNKSEDNKLSKTSYETKVCMWCNQKQTLKPKKLQNTSSVSRHWTVRSLHLLLWQSWSELVNGAFCGSCIIHFLQADSRSFFCPSVKEVFYQNASLLVCQTSSKTAIQKMIFIRVGVQRIVHLFGSREQKNQQREILRIRKRGGFLHNGQWFMIIYLAKVAIRSVHIYSMHDYKKSVLCSAVQCRGLFMNSSSLQSHFALFAKRVIKYTMNKIKG